MNPENNNQAAPTTVGGVTFGGGNNTATPVQNTTPAPQAEGVDPIVESTGEEFDAVMSGAAVPQQDFNQAPVPSNLSVPVASPTHFDTQNTVNPIVNDPVGVNMQQPAVATKKTKTPEELDKQVKKFSMLTIVFGFLTAICAVLAVVGLVLFINDETKLADTTAQLEKTEKIVKAVEETTGVTITRPEEVPVYKATTGYIYLSSWNIKIKIPENLEKVSYILNENYRENICFNAVGKGVQYFPDFANIALNPGKHGCLTRIKTTEGEFDAATGVSFGTKVFTYKEYSYFYTGPTDYSQDAANLGLEHTADQYIRNMLTNNIEQYE